MVGHIEEEDVVYKHYFTKIFTILMVVSIALDFVLAYFGYKTISSITWAATAAHPTLIAAGVLATCYTAYVLNNSWKYVLFVGLIGGHLFTHW